MKAVRESIGDVGEKAGHATSEAASKATEAASDAKVPLIVGGAVLAAASAGAALAAAARPRKTKVLGVKLPKPTVKFKTKDLVKAADRVASAGEQIGSAGERIGRVSASVRKGTRNGVG